MPSSLRYLGRLLSELLIFGCQIEIALPQMLRADLSELTAFLCPLGIGLLSDAPKE